MKTDEEYMIEFEDRFKKGKCYYCKSKRKILGVYPTESAHRIQYWIKWKCINCGITHTQSIGYTVYTHLNKIYPGV